MSWYLMLSAVLFCLGVYGVLARRNAIAVLMSVELMLNAVIINLLTFWRFEEPLGATGQAFAAFVYAVAAAEVAVGLALIISAFRNRETIDLDQITLLKW